MPTIASPAGWKQDLALLTPIAALLVLFGVTALMIVVHHPVEPVDVPAMSVDLASLEAVAERDRRARMRLEAAPSPREIRAIGTAMLAWNEGALTALEGNGAGAAGVDQGALRDELAAAVSTANQHLGFEALQRLLGDQRALQTELFLAEVAARAASHGPLSQEQRRLAGALDLVLERTGWIAADGSVHVPMSVLRARYKLHWTTVVFGVGDCEASPPQECMGLTTLPMDVGELRAVLAYLFAHPVVHPADLGAAGGASRAVDRRRIAYLSRMAALDEYIAAHSPSHEHPLLTGYPVAEAAAVLMYRTGNYAAAARAFEALANDRRTDARLWNWWRAARERSGLSD